MKKWGALFIIVPLFFLSGYLMGTNQDLFEKFLHIYQKEVTILLEDPSILPAEVLQSLQKRVIFRILPVIEMKPDEIRTLAEGCDLLLVRQKTLFLWKLKPNMEFVDWIHRKEVSNKISPDFLTKDIFENGSYPLFWSIVDNKLRVVSLFAPQNKAAQINKLKKLTEEILNPEVMKPWLALVSRNTTLMQLDETLVNVEKKSFSLREHDLSKLRWE